MRKLIAVFFGVFLIGGFIQSGQAQTVKDKLDSIVIEQYINGNPVLSKKRVMQYNHSEQLILEDHYDYNRSNASWEKRSRVAFGYDQNKLDSKLLYFTWDAVQQEWDSFNKILFSYTPTKKLSQVESYYYDAGIWELLYVMDYTYNVVDKLELEELEHWSGGNIKANTKIEYFYHPDYRFDYSITSSNWSGSWKNESRLDYSYAGNKDFMGTSSSEWKDSTNAFLQTRHTSYIRDFMDNMENIGEIVDTYYADGSTFDSSIYYHFTYDLTVNKSDLVYREDVAYPIPYLNKLVSIRAAVDTVGLGNTNDQINRAIKTYYYSPYTPTSVGSVLRSGTLIYPNPAVNEINVQNAERNFDGVVVYDMLGNKVLSTSLQHFRPTLDISALPSGTYMLQLEEDGVFYTEKFVKP